MLVAAIPLTFAPLETLRFPLFIVIPSATPPLETYISP